MQGRTRQAPSCPRAHPLLHSSWVAAKRSSLLGGCCCCCCCWPGWLPAGCSGYTGVLGKQVITKLLPEHQQNLYTVMYEIKTGWATRCTLSPQRCEQASLHLGLHWASHAPPNIPCPSALPSQGGVQADPSHAPKLGFATRAQDQPKRTLLWNITTPKLSPTSPNCLGRSNETDKPKKVVVVVFMIKLQKTFPVLERKGGR